MLNFCLPLLQEKAPEFSQKRLNVENFIASNSWLESFKKRHNISQKVLCGESSDSFKRRISDLLENYKKEDTLNANECDLFYQTMLNKTFAAAGHPRKNWV